MLRELESQLMLLGWANREFGFESNQELFDALGQAREGYDAAGHSHVARMLASRDGSRVPRGDLDRYDDNVSRHLSRINQGGREKITLRYFQQIAAIYAELFLSRRAAAPEALAHDIHKYVQSRRGDFLIGEITAADLNKLAFWMATGSGKTLIMHLNYLQFLHYSGSERLDNIILITPNEGLSSQHMAEMSLSGIASARLGDAGLHARESRTVRVTEITKLVEKKKGKGAGVSITVDALGDRNLVFVDEGHRGATGTAWHTVRDAVGARGFTFEYSATFGQALAAAKDNQLTLHYGKSIVFDYSYRYFHGDGFGKDFRVLNVSGSGPAKEPGQDLTDLLFFGNLLSFYEQLRAYQESGPALRKYNLEQPLWAFVGGSVNAVYKLQGRDTSDVLSVQLFLQRVLSRPEWAQSAIAKLLKGESGLYTAGGADLFRGRFNDLEKLSERPEQLYFDILHKVFHVSGPSGLILCDIRDAPGELGLKAAGSDQYFGLTYIGDTPKFKKLAKRADAGIHFEEDVVGGSLFGRVNAADATVNILIGAKKFVEGWNSWRVSSMGLMNVGMAKGSEIIQLFGRGVRLKGKGMSLKRSTHLDGPHPGSVELLEMLNIFAVRADYMHKFREYLEREGLETQDPVILHVPVQVNDDFVNRGLAVPALPDGSDFRVEANLALDASAASGVMLDVATHAASWESGGGGRVTEGSAGVLRSAGDLPLGLVDWGEAYLNLMEYRRKAGMRGLAVPPPAELRLIVGQADITVSADPNVVRPKTWSDRKRLQSTVHAVLRKCAEKCWHQARRRWEADRMNFREVTEAHPNILLNAECASVRGRDAREQAHYLVSVDREKAALISDVGALDRIHCDRHIYQPLLIQQSDPAITISPPPLNDGETRFVCDLHRFWASRADSALYADTELYLLRNQSRGRGVRFSLGGADFYPDFILWAISGDRQRIVFVEPHGMMYAPAYEGDEKARLHEWLPQLAVQMAGRSSVAGTLTLDSFIVSVTEYCSLRRRYGNGEWTKEDFAERHILFPDSEGVYLEALLAEGSQRP